MSACSVVLISQSFQENGESPIKQKSELSENVFLNTKFSIKMSILNVLLIIFSVVVHAKCVGEKENGFDRKGFDLGLETCIENFDVHVDKIIRTQDSRAMGAKYLNEAEVNGRDECMKLCCETFTCDVFVYEQKIPGSCYLFHCGSPEDFKCKFTQHRNYTSAVLALNNRLSELENRMKLTKHEEELNMLRKLDVNVETTTLPSVSTKVPAVVAQSKQNKSQCSRYQFECRGSGECIAIYNACDGIPQCADGSDEASELYCPTITGTTHPKTFHEQLKSLKDGNENLPQPEKLPEVPISAEPTTRVKQHPVKATVPARQYQSSGSMSYFPYGYSPQNEQAPEASHPKVEAPQQIPNQPRYYGREGELLQYPIGNGQWQGYQGQRQDEGSHIFNHKGNVLTPEASDSHYTAPYNEMSHADYLKYAANNGYYSGSGPVYYPGPNGWPQRLPQQPHSLEDVPQRPLLSMYGNGMSGSVPSDYYYEDSQLRNRFSFVAQDPRRIQNSDKQQQGIPMKETDKQETLHEVYKEEQPKKKESVKKVLENITSTSIKTSAKAEATTAAAVVKEEKPHGVAEHLKMNDGDVDGLNERPSGAILSLTLGMCITAIMITLVGCRLRVVRKRMRRNSKSPYAHDADFLVNGMYL